MIQAKRSTVYPSFDQYIPVVNVGSKKATCLSQLQPLYFSMVNVDYSVTSSSLLAISQARVFTCNIYIVVKRVDDKQRDRIVSTVWELVRNETSLRETRCILKDEK